MFNANNYGYNPYGTYIPQRPIQQPIEQPQQYIQQNNKTGLNGKQVESIDVVKAMDIPLDGISYFPLFDGSAIITKQIQLDGTSKTVVYKPINEENKEQIKYLVADDLEDLKDEIKDIKSELKDLKKKKKDD